MKTRFQAALAAYAALGVMAFFTLDGKFLAIVLIVLAGLAVKTVAAYKSGKAER
jgi:hypothetical protein